MLQDLLNIVFPSNCITCKKTLFKGEKYICTSCHFNIPKGDRALTANSDSGQLLYEKKSFKGSTHLYYFDKDGKTQKILHQLKYKTNQDFGIFLGELMGADFKKALPKIDFLVPVPLHPKKLYKRGFNQSELLARGMNKLLKINISTTVLIRTRFTETQTKKGKKERIKNMKDAFEITDKKTFKNKTILLIDDVITTGSTLKECVRELDKIEGISIYVLLLAVASH